MKTCLSDTRFTEREIRTVKDTLDAIRRETRRERPRPIRISNLCNRISLTVANAERRKVKCTTEK